MKILSVGSMRNESNTCRQRTMALKKLYGDVDIVEASAPVSFLYRVAYHLFLLGLPVPLPDSCNANDEIKRKISENTYDLLWIDKGVTIRKGTLQYVKKVSPNTKIVSFSPDNMALRHNQSQDYLESLPLYDIVFSTKSYNLDDMRKLGAKNVFFVHKTYSEDFHYPRVVTEDDKKRLGCDVGFVGAWEQERMDSILYLSRNGIKVRVFGSKEWQKCKGDNENLYIEDHGLFNEDYAKSFRCFKISLCFLRKMNYDQQTARTMEIPACGGFMVAERTQEHLELFEEDKEAVFFSNNEELLEKCEYYLEHDEEREKIAEAGRQRCINSGYSNSETLKGLVGIVFGGGTWINPCHFADIEIMRRP